MDKVVLAPAFSGHYTHLVEIDEYANLYVMDEGDKNSKRSALVEWLAQVIVAATTALEPCGYDTEKQRQLMEEVKKENKGKNFWWRLSRYDEEEYLRVEDAEERAEMAELSEQDKQEISDFFAENKHLKRVRASVEESFRAVAAEIWVQANKIDQLQAENEELKRENERLKLKAGTDMTKPQPCNMFDVADGEAWAKELGKHMYDVVRDVIYMDQFFDCVERADEAALAEKLTYITTVCTSWLAALGYDEAMRGEMQRHVNEKNKERGYFGSD